MIGEVAEQLALGTRATGGGLAGAAAVEHLSQMPAWALREKLKS